VANDLCDNVECDHLSGRDDRDLAETARLVKRRGQIVTAVAEGARSRGVARSGEAWHGDVGASNRCRQRGVGRMNAGTP